MHGGVEFGGVEFGGVLLGRLLEELLQVLDDRFEEVGFVLKQSDLMTEFDVGGNQLFNSLELDGEVVFQVLLLLWRA